MVLTFKLAVPLNITHIGLSPEFCVLPTSCRIADRATYTLRVYFESYVVNVPYPDPMFVRYTKGARCLTKYRGGNMTARVAFWLLTLKSALP